MPEDLDPPAGRLRLKITCPLSPVVDMIADTISLPTPTGPCLILPQRAPTFMRLSVGRLSYTRSDGPAGTFLISCGTAEIRRHICAITAWALRPDEVHPDKIRHLLSDAEALLPRLSSPAARYALESRIDFYRFLLSQNS